MSAAIAPADQTDESPPPPPPPPPVSEAQRSLPTPFLTKTYQMVEDPAVNDVISWNEDGSTFVVWRPAEFALDLLPKYFKHNNFSSFVRQLNTYGFRKIVPDRWEFSNEFFRKGEKRMLCDIHRKKFSLPTVAVAVAVPVPVSVPSALVIPAYRSGSPADRSGSSTNSGEFQLEQVSMSSSLPEVTTGSAAAPPESTVELVDENERLRKENRKLASELTHMKNICNSIFVLMSKYANVPGFEQPPLEALELMPVSRILEEAEEICVKSDEPMLSLTAATGSSSWYYEASPMLFGVSIGEKRYREENDGEEEQTATTDPPEVKLEPEPLHLVETEAAASEASAASAAAEEEQQPWVVYCPRPQRACNGHGREFMKLDGSDHVT